MGRIMLWRRLWLDMLAGLLLLAAVVATPQMALAQDVSVTIAAVPSTVTLGQQVDFVVTISNSGPVDAHNVSVTADVPGFPIGASVTGSSGWTYNQNASSVTATAASMSPGAATLRITILPGTSGPLGATASISSDNDPVMTNNRDAATLSVDASGNLLELGWGTYPARPAPGGIIEYDLILRNGEPMNAGYSLELFLPADLISVDTVARGDATATDFSGGLRLGVSGHICGRPMP